MRILHPDLPRTAAAALRLVDHGAGFAWHATTSSTSADHPSTGDGRFHSTSVAVSSASQVSEGSARVE